MLLQAKSVAKIYDSKIQSRPILNNVSLKINKGDFLGIHGPSGSGKTTLLYCLSGLETIDSGEIIFDGKSLNLMNKEDKSYLRKNNIGFVFQFFHLIPQLTVYENIMLANVIADKYEPERVEELLIWVDMEKYKTYYPSQLSGGMQQRVAIARALVNQPTILFADEPTGNLDQEHGKEIMNLLLRLNQEQGLSIIMVTHNEDYLKYCTKTLKLIDGEVFEDQ